MNKPPIKSKIFLVDDNPTVLECLKKLINRQADLEVCGESENAQMAVHVIPLKRPDLAIVDLGLQDMNGLNLIKVLKDENNWLRILVLSMHDEQMYGEQALKAGAQGYLMKQLSIENILKAMRIILSGDTYMSDQLKRQLNQGGCHGGNGMVRGIE